MDFGVAKDFSFYTNEFSHKFGLFSYVALLVLDLFSRLVFDLLSVII